MILLTNDCNVV